jgi:uncharacterized protein (DUF924 family)
MTAQSVLDFWFAHEADWFRKTEAFDTEVRARFLPWVDRVPLQWLDSARDCLARIIVLDQFPRNMFRGTARAFATDALALAAAKQAIARGYDTHYSEKEKLFAYLPLEHSESLADQEQACALMQPLGAELYRYALAHRDIIARFGRFPHRNAILGRSSTPEELEFLKQPGSGF